MNRQPMPMIEAGSPADPVIVFLHGGPLSSRMWEPQLERLKDDFYCLAPDLPGHGKNAANPFSLASAAQAVAELIRSRTPDGRAVVVGLSLGGAVTLELLRECPEVVSHALVSGTAAKLGSFLGRLSMTMAGWMGWIPAEKQAQMIFTQLQVPTAARLLVWEDFIQCATPAYTRMVTQALMAMQLPESVGCPLLVAVGEKETIPARQAAEKLLRLYPGASGVVVPGLHHLWNLQHPGLFADTVRAWALGQELPAKLAKVNRRNS